LQYTLRGATEASGTGWPGVQNLNRGVTEVTYTGCEQASFANFLGSPAFLPDGMGIEYVLPVDVTGFDDGQTVADAGGLVSICVNIEHSWVGDLDIWLECPDGTRLTLMIYDPAIATTGQTFGRGDRFTDLPDSTAWYCWSLAAEETILSTILADNITGGDMIPPGDYLPIGEEDLSQCPLNGEWSLNFRDNLLATPP